MRQASLLCSVFFAGGMALYATAARAQDIEWNYNNQGVLGGNGCNTQFGDTFLTSAGNQFFITFTRMTLEMDAGTDRTKALNCRGRIPVRVRGNIVVEKVKQTLSFSWSKTYGSSGGVFARNRWFGRSLGVLNKSYPPSQQGTQPFVEVENETVFSWPCTPSEWTYGTLDADIGLSALRNNPASEAISLNVAGQDFKYTALVFTYPGC